MTTMENIKLHIGDVVLQGERCDGVVRIQWFGLCPETGAGLFIKMDKLAYLPHEETDCPWRATLWPGYADDEPAPPAEEQNRRFAKLSDARAALTASYRAHLRTLIN